MMKSRILLVGALVAATVAFVGCSGINLPMMSTVSATNPMSGTQEVPPRPGAGSGSVKTTLDKETRKLTWVVTYSGLTGPVTAGHFHGPATAGQNAGVVVPFSGNLTSPIEGSATLTEAQMADLLAGKWYANLHTAANPPGEIRGQVSGL